MHNSNKDKYRIVAISNPRSGRNKRGGFKKFNNAIANFSAIHHIVTQGQADLLQALNFCKQQASEILIINGGDGSLLQILTYLKLPQNQNYNPCLVLLQAGTTSMAYGDVGCKGKLDDVFSKVVHHHISQQLVQTKRDVLRMTLPEKSQTVCGMFFGAGAIYNGILYCRQKLHTKGVRGELGPSVAMIRYIFDWLTLNKMTTSTRAYIKYNENYSAEGDYTIVTATTLKRLLMGVYPFWGAHMYNANIAFTFIKKNAPKAFHAFRKIIFGKAPDVELQQGYYNSAYCSKVHLKINDGFTLDGELFGEAGSLTIVELESAGEVTFLT